MIDIHKEKEFIEKFFKDLNNMGLTYTQPLRESTESREKKPTNQSVIMHQRSSNG